MLDGDNGEVAARSLRLLVTLGELYGAERMLLIDSVQVAGVSYKALGEPGMLLLEDYARLGARVRAFTLLNPASIDLEDWKSMGIGASLAEKQLRIISAFRQMGVLITASCTPYLAGFLPRFRQHLAWSESSAVSCANSVIGARTNREGGPSALAAAICGVTPDYGLHRGENRHPQIVVRVETQIKSPAEYGALGYCVGGLVQERIPYLRGLDNPSTDNLKSLGAAMAASGAVALYHVDGVTPEADLVSCKGLETVAVGPKEIKETYEKLSETAEADIVFVGCPHASLKEIQEYAEAVRGKRLKKPVWISTSRMFKDAADRMGLTEVITSAGGRVVADTCCVALPMDDLGYRVTGVNSGKAAHYLPGHCKQRVVFADIGNLIEEADR
jgi:predicted aconitase